MRPQASHFDLPARYCVQCVSGKSTVNKKHGTATAFLLRFFCFLFLFSTQSSSQSSVRFAVIGDYGNNSHAESDVAALIRSWNPEFIVTTGDNNYEFGEAATIDQNIGKYFHDFISPYTGTFGPGDTVNRFFPCLGNHDWIAAGAAPYLNYFTLPGNERYYDFAKGPVHFYAIDSDPHEPDGMTDTSTQAIWLKNALAVSQEPWKIVYFHHPPYNSGAQHGPAYAMRWPFKAWGATTVLSGHEHVYERLIQDNLLYVINGLGGRSIHLFSSVPDTGSRVRYNSDYGAMLVDAGPDSMNLTFVNRRDSVIDSYTLERAAPQRVREHERPAAFALFQNYPNPFNPTTEVSFVISAEGGSASGGSHWSFVKLKVYDVLGQEVTTLVSRNMEPGSYSVTFNGEKLVSGVYYYRLQSGGVSDVKKMVLVK